ncbi:TRAP transporter large permease subunit [Temperatibacter marinus]|uniref:TRAP transporter large permease protein n=1 Tax=Temperatibacter marinus TaxID=1456591 RepID=A0AA52HB82_9PROT|nr:TRAP transporter large permease subunit [Temperatibacter marinus]WND03500.1 TRAP transporter large permease subunit [Temperatibacter marinus]
MSALFLTTSLAAMLILRQRIVVMLGFAAAFCYLAWGDGKLSYVVLDVWAAADQEVLLSIPLFILAGNIMSRGSIARRLIKIMQEATNPIPGGLAIATILSCAFFAAISGSSTVTLIAVGSVMYPALLDAGYSKKFALGALCAAGTLGIIVPPSIPLILYGVMTETSIADLFKAGVGPAILLTGLMVIYAVIINRNQPRAAFNLSSFLGALKEGIFALFMPVLILGGIYAGWFTATESAAVAVTYAILVEFLIHKDMSLSDLKGTTLETATMMGSLFPLLMMALSINTFMSYEQLPHDLVHWMSGLISDPVTFLLVTLVLLLIVGTFMDIGSAILIIAPLLLPLALAQNIDPVHFGIIMITNLELGYLTPPLGLNLIVAMTAFNEDFWLIAKSVIPFLLIMLLGLLIITFVPALSLMFV